MIELPSSVKSIIPTGIINVTYSKHSCKRVDERGLDKNYILDLNDYKVVRVTERKGVLESFAIAKKKSKRECEVLILGKDNLYDNLYRVITTFCSELSSFTIPQRAKLGGPIKIDIRSDGETCWKIRYLKGVI